MNIPTPDASGLTNTTELPLHWARYAARGAPGSPLLLLHGGPGAHHDYLLPQMLRLADRHALLFYDQRGGGRSRTDDRTPIGWRTHVADLGRVVEEMALRPLSLVGYSWGGLLAMLYAVEAFRGAAGLVPPARMALIDPAPVTRAFRERFEAEFARRQAGADVRRLREELASSGLRERDPDAYRQRQFELGVAGYFAHPERAHDLTPFRVTGRVQQSVWESLGDFDLTASLAEVRCPVFIAHGRQDPIPLGSSEAAASALPDARLVVLEESGHVPYVEAPDALFGALARWLDETEPAAATGAVHLTEGTGQS